MKKLLIGLFLATISTATYAAARNQDFLALRQAYQAGNTARVNMYAQRLRGHVLEPYAAYYQLRPQLWNPKLSPETVKEFVEKYHDSPLSDRLMGEWLKILGWSER